MDSPETPDEPLPSLPWHRAAALFGVDALRSEAPTSQVLQEWRTDGVPWDVAGPLAMATLTTERPGPRYLTLVAVVNAGREASKGLPTTEPPTTE